MLNLDFRSSFYKKISIKMTDECDEMNPNLSGRFICIQCWSRSVVLDNEMNGYGDDTSTFRICCLGRLISFWLEKSE
jgi:hypothetical protein